MYDVIIIGGGPAGVSASLYAKRSNLNVLILYYGNSNLEKTTKIDNYYGFGNGIDARELYINGIKQAKKIGVKVKNEEVLKVEKIEKCFKVKTNEGFYEGKTIILATGNKKISPNIKGISEFEGKGVSYCAICDGYFFKNKNVAVIGNGEYALNEAEELSNIVNNITILTNGQDLKNDTKYEVNNKKIKSIEGKEKVETIIFEDNSKLEIDGIFIALGKADGIDFAKTLGIITENKSIKVNEKMETNIKGLYACGDITGGLLQICKASYEGAIAGIQTTKYCRGRRPRRPKKIFIN